jgi:hypothetical protein
VSGAEAARALLSFAPDPTLCIVAGRPGWAVVRGGVPGVRRLQSAIWVVICDFLSCTDPQGDRFAILIAQLHHLEGTKAKLQRFQALRKVSQIESEFDV